MQGHERETIKGGKYVLAVSTVQNRTTSASSKSHRETLLCSELLLLPERVWPGAGLPRAGLDFVQERFHNTKPGDTEDIYESWGQWNKGGLGQRKQQERDQAGLPPLTEKSEKGGPWRQVQGVSLGQAASAHCSPGSKPCGGP